MNDTPIVAPLHQFTDRNDYSFLPKHQRDVVELRLAGHTYQEIAPLLNIAVGTVRSRLNRAREAIVAKEREVAHQRANQILCEAVALSARHGS